MSSILDALERASQDRQPGKEDLLPQMQSPKETRSIPLLLLAMGLVLILIAVTLWLLFSTGDDNGNPKAQKRQSPSQVEEPQSAPVLKQSTGVHQVLPEKPTGKKSRQIAERIRSVGQPNQHSLVSEAKLSKKAPTAQMASPKPMNQTPRPSQSQAAAQADRSTPTLDPAQGRQPLPGAVKENQVDPVATLGHEKLDATEPVVTGESERQRVEEPRIPLIWEMEQGLREQLEQLKTSIHVYNEEPSQRFVIINMRRYSEGDILGVNGYRLHRIDRDGIIVDYGKGLVRLLRDKY
ncbi:MAG: general secretion pathway protein GspB [Candidatus Thiodiazotropha sp.]